LGARAQATPNVLREAAGLVVELVRDAHRGLVAVLGGSIDRAGFVADVAHAIGRCYGRRAVENPVLPLRFRDDPEFLADLPYDPEVLFFDELLEVDREKSLVRCRMPTDETLPITRSQRAPPLHHPRHVAGTVMVHATGMLGFVHAYHILGLRHRDGWIGYGTHIPRVVFRKLVTPGAPIEAVCQATRSRIGKVRH